MDGIVVTKGGRIVARETGRGIGPALKLFREGVLSESEVADHIVGRAAAAIFVAGGVVRVWADVMSEGAAAFLEGYGVVCGAEQHVKTIVNRQRTGACPMEIAVAGLCDPLSMVSVIERKLNSLGGRHD